jgi:hypothetical protein
MPARSVIDVSSPICSGVSLQASLQARRLPLCYRGIGMQTNAALIGRTIAARQLMSMKMV